MALSVKDIMGFMEGRAPKELACDWDNVGLQIGDAEMQVDKVLLALDLSMPVLNEAVAAKAQMIVVHHPVLFRPLQALHTGEPLVRLLSAALQAQVAVYAAHTNLDAAVEGVSTVLARRLGLKEISPLPGTVLGRGGMLAKPMLFSELMTLTKEKLSLKGFRYYGNPNSRIFRVAVCGGSGGSLVEAAVRFGAQVLITGDIGYHDLLEARDRGMLLMDAGHAETEHPVIEDLAGYLHQCAAKKNIQLACLVSQTDLTSLEHEGQ